MKTTFWILILNLITLLPALSYGNPEISDGRHDRVIRIETIQGWGKSTSIPAVVKVPYTLEVESERDSDGLTGTIEYHGSIGTRRQQFYTIGKNFASMADAVKFGNSYCSKMIDQGQRSFFGENKQLRAITDMGSHSTGTTVQLDLPSVPNSTYPAHLLYFIEVVDPITGEKNSYEKNTDC